MKGDKYQVSLTAQPMNPWESQTGLKAPHWRHLVVKGLGGGNHLFLGMFLKLMYWNYIRKGLWNNQMMKKRYRKRTKKNNCNQLCINDSSITHEHPTHCCNTQACRWCHRAPRAWHVRCAGSLWASVQETGKWENVAILTRDPNREKMRKGFWRSKTSKSSDGEWHWRQYSSSSFAWYTVPYKSDTEKALFITDSTTQVKVKVANMDIESFSKISAEDWVWNFLRSPYSPTGNLETARRLCIEPWSKQMNSKNDRQTLTNHTNLLS